MAKKHRDTAYEYNNRPTDSLGLFGTSGVHPVVNRPKLRSIYLPPNGLPMYQIVGYLWLGLLSSDQLVYTTISLYSPIGDNVVYYDLIL